MRFYLKKANRIFGFNFSMRYWRGSFYEWAKKSGAYLFYPLDEDSLIY